VGKVSSCCEGSWACCGSGGGGGFGSFLIWLLLVLLDVGYVICGAARGFVICRTSEGFEDRLFTKIGKVVDG
jgi:hypothetical protein